MRCSIRSSSPDEEALVTAARMRLPAQNCARLRSAISVVSTGRQPRRCCVSALEAGLSMPAKRASHARLHGA